VQNILEDYGQNVMALYHKLLLINLIKSAITRLPGMNLPGDIQDLYLKNFNRIISDLSQSEPIENYLYSNDKFFKKLAICNFRLIPVGARKINQSKLPIKKFMFKKGARQFIDIMWFVLFELRGIVPLYIGHIDSNDANLKSELNKEGLHRAYIRIVELLKINKHIKGYFGTSWLLDPQLDQINYRHRYNREFCIRNGAKLYYQGPSREARKNSLKTSATRRRLFEEGKYIPTDYVVIWSRKRLIKWAEEKALARV